MSPVTQDLGKRLACLDDARVNLPTSVLWDMEGWIPVERIDSPP